MEVSKHSSMTAVQAYTTGCRNSPGCWGRDSTVFRSCRDTEGTREPRGQEARAWQSQGPPPGPAQFS